MNKKQLEYFMEAYRCRNIQTAANNLYISHQGLSRVIRLLEDELGQSLFVRSNRGLEPTDFATMLLPHVQTLLDTYARIEGVQTLAGQKKSVVTIYTLNHILGCLGTGFVLRFHEEHPDITLSVVDTTDEHALESLFGGNADFAIVSDPIDNTRFSCEELFYSRYCFRIHSDNPLAHRERLTREDFNGQKLIGRGREYNCFRKNIDKLIFAENIHIDLPIETSDEQLTQELVEQNLAIAVDYDFCALSHCGPNTVIRYLDEPGYGQNICLVGRSNTLPTKAGRIFKSFLLEWMKNMPPHRHNGACPEEVRRGHPLNEQTLIFSGIGEI